MEFSNITIKEFINKIIKYDNVNEILNLCVNQQEKGFIYERLWDLIIKFGFCNLFNNSNFYHLTGNVNNGRLRVLKNYTKYLNKNTISGNESGCSDITLLNKTDETFIFISSKFFKTNDNNVSDYDIQNIIAVIKENENIYLKFEIYLLVFDKSIVLNKFLNSKETSNYITKYITKDSILDIEDLNKYFILFKQDIIKNFNEDWTNLYLNKKENLKLRFHQELITNKTIDLINQNHKNFLWGCKCRSGKTYMTGGIILKLLNKFNNINILIITPAPTETIPQFTDDLFDKFIDFNNFKIHSLIGKNIKNIELGNNNIFIVSKQLLQKYINNKKINELNVKMIIFDENHRTSTNNFDDSDNSDISQ